MSKKDTLDPELARRFAWRAKAEDADLADEDDEDEDDEDEDDEDEDDEEEEDADPEVTRQRWARARRGAEELADGIRRVAAMKGKATQAATTEAILRRLHRDMVEAICLSDHAAETLLLWKLTVKHFRRLSRRARSEHVYGLVGAPLPIDEAGAADLVEAVASSDEATLIALVDGALSEKKKPKRRHPEVEARLCKLVADGKTWRAREAAAEWLPETRFEAAIPALRRALRMPRLPLRVRALALLLQTDALTEDDVLWLLRDAEAHPLLGAWGERNDERGKEYAELLLAAAAKVRPMGGLAPLEKISGWSRARGMSGPHGWDAKWALRVMGAAYPAEGRHRIERALLHHGSRYTPAIADAIGSLPEEVARPLLREAAARPGPYLAERAKKVYFARFGVECPVGELDGVPLSLLAEPPSDKLRACVAVLRNGKQEAVTKLLVSLLAEGPGSSVRSIDELTSAQREALALWIFAARDASGGDELPSIPAYVGPALAHHFGAAAFPGLLLLAERDLMGGLDHEWLSCLTSLLSPPHPPSPDPPYVSRSVWGKLAAEVRLAVGEAERAELRAIARRALAAPGWEGSTGPLSALDAAGLEAEDVDTLLRHLPALSLVDDGSPHRHAAYLASAYLGTAPALPGLDEKLEAAARAALAAGEHRLFGQLASACGRRKISAVVELVWSLVDELDARPELGKAISYAFAFMGAEPPPEAWVVERLRRPESRAFEVALGKIGKAPTLPMLDALRAALDSGARDGASAASAAGRLLWLSAIGPEDPRLDGILERAPVEDRASLLAMLVSQKAPLPKLRAHLMELLTRHEYEEIGPLLHTLDAERHPELTPLAEDALPLAICPRVRRNLEYFLDEPGEELTYWQELGDEIDAEDDEEDEDLA
jgi:hypothetical protein